MKAEGADEIYRLIAERARNFEVGSNILVGLSASSRPGLFRS